MWQYQSAMWCILTCILVTNNSNYKTTVNGKEDMEGRIVSGVNSEEEKGRTEGGVNSEVEMSKIVGPVNSEEKKGRIVRGGANSAEEMEGRIVGGRSVSIETYPSSVILSNMGAQCSGSILTSHAVLTAAHCFNFNKDTEEMMIHVGSRFRFDHSGQPHRVAYIAIHENFNKAMMFSCDVAIVFVMQPIQLGLKAKRAVIVDHNRWMNEDERNFIVAGWGMLTYDGALPDILKMAELRFIPKQECTRLHKMNFTDDMFCLYGEGKKDSCKGDSGAGVLWQDKLVGLVSHGDGCAQRNKPSVYANVWFFRNWINNTLSDFYNNYYCRNIETNLFKKPKNI